MPLRPLALAALLLLASVPGTAHAAETEPPPPPAADSAVSVPPPGPPADDEPADPLPETDPADTSTAAPGSGGPSAPDAGSTPPDEQSSPAPDGHVAPEPEGVRADEDRARDGRAGDRRAGDARTDAAPGTPPDPAAAELPALERASFVGPGTAVAHRPGAGALVRQESSLRAQIPPGRQEVTPGTLTRISLGTVTRVPAQDAAGDSSTTGWVAGLSALGAAAVAAVVARRSRTHHAR
jgi:hypothetical protein